MSYRKIDYSGLQEYIPDGSLDAVVHYLKLYKVHLKITAERRTVHGTYRNATSVKQHLITVNGTLNKYAFLITFLHELAHLTTFEKYRNQVPPHGREWKTEFGKILIEFLSKNIFPKDIEAAILRSLHNPGASSCSNPQLNRVLKQYDEGRHESIMHVEDLKPGEHFLIRGGRRFIKGEKVRTRYKCQEAKTAKWYLFQALYEVKKVDPLP